MEKILDIQEVTFKMEEHDGLYYELYYDGYEILTDQQTIRLGIQNRQQCCEDFGHFFTNDDISEFIGAQLLSIQIVDKLLHKKKFEELGDLYYGGAMFIHIETNKGILEFVAYNSHNGYYGHDAVVISKQLHHLQEL